jgi:hypothetical protein
MKQIEPIKANCRKCYTLTRLEKWLTFSYWYCPTCKDEVDVNLSTISSPKGELYGYGGIQSDSEIQLADEGVYLIEYFDGTYEYFKREGSETRRPTRLNGEMVRSTTRLTWRDVPDRKPVQSLSETYQGAESQGQSVRLDADEKNSVSGHSAGWSHIVIDSSQDDFDPFSAAINDGSSSISRVPDNFEEALQDLGYDSKCVQHGKMPPPDCL